MGKRLKDKTCYWCGAPATSRDHVVPKQMFPSPPGAALLTVPACDEHNAKLSEDEEYFRLVMVGNAAFATRPLAEELALGPIRRSASRSRRAGLAHLLGDPISMFVPGPRGIEPARMISLDRTRLDRVVEKVVRGLSYTKGSPVRADARFNTYHFNCLQFPGHLEKWFPSVAFKGQGLNLNPEVFTCRYLTACRNSHELSAWWLLFYESYLCVVMVSQSVEDDAGRAEDLVVEPASQC